MDIFVDKPVNLFHIPITRYGLVHDDISLIPPVHVHLHTLQFERLELQFLLSRGPSFRGGQYVSHARPGAKLS